MDKHASGYLYAIAAIAAITGLLLGFDTGIISGALLFLKKEFTLSIWMQEMIVSSVLFGAMLGTLISGQLTDAFGRKKLLLAVGVLFMIGTFIATCASQINGILLGRMLIGAAIGMGSNTAPVYIAEISTFEKRGALVTLYQLAITLGILASFLINFAFTNAENSWRMMFAVGLIPAILLCIGMVFLPESPRYLIKNNNIAAAEKILKRLRKRENVSHEINEICDSLKIKNASFKEVFSPWMRPVLFLGVMLGLIQQVTGINTIIYYAPSIFELAGFHDATNAILATVGIGVVNVLATFFAIYYLDKWGRRPLLLSGLTGMGFSLLVLSLAFHYGENNVMLKWVSICCTFTYIICFAFSLGAILWLSVSEIFPLEVRATAMSLAVLSCWLWNFIVSSTFLTLLNGMGASETFLMYAALCALSYIFCYYKMPETKGVSLEQIDKNIRAGMPLREIGLPVEPSLPVQDYQG